MKDLSLLKKIAVVLALLVISVATMTIATQETEALSVTTTIKGEGMVVKDDKGKMVGLICGPGQSTCQMTYDFPDINLTL